MASHSNHNYCLNCNHPFSVESIGKEEIFCINCGQSNKESKLSMWKLVRDGVSNIFNLDSRLIHTIRDICYPSKLTQTYIAGKRKYYVNPVRLFIFTLIITISAVIYLAKFEEIEIGNKSMYAKAEDSKLLDRFDKLTDSLEMENHQAVSDTIREKLFKDVNNIETDTIGQKENIQLFNIGKLTHEYGISTYDAVHLNKEQLYQKYKIEGFWKRIKVSQYIRILTNPQGTLAFVVKNLTWAVIITLIFMSFFLKILYYRGRYYTVEHAIFLLNLHSFGFLVVGFAILLNTLTYSLFDSYDGYYDVLLAAPILFGFVVQYLAIKRYYGHNIFTTFLAQGLINFVYFIIFLFASLLVALISVFLY